MIINKRKIKKIYKNRLRFSLREYNSDRGQQLLTIKEVYNIKMILRCNSFIRKYTFSGKVSYCNILTFNKSTLRRFL